MTKRDPRLSDAAERSAERELVLQPALTDLTHDEILAHLAEVRSRRMVAAIEYQIGVNVKIDRANEVLSRRLAQAYHMLGGEIERLDKLDSAIQKRLNTIESFKQEIAFNSTVRQEVEEERDDD